MLAATQKSGTRTMYGKVHEEWRLFMIEPLGAPKHQEYEQIWAIYLGQNWDN